MVAYPVGSDEPANNPTLISTFDQAKAVERRVSILEKPTGLSGGTVSSADLAAAIATRAPVGLSNIATLDFPSIPANTIASLTISVPGAIPGDTVALGAPAAIEAGLMWSGFVSAADTVTIRLRNGTGAAIDPASAVWKASVIR